MDSCFGLFRPHQHGIANKQVRFSYWGVLNLCIKISPIFYIANANPNPAGPRTPKYGNYPNYTETDPGRLTLTLCIKCIQTELTLLTIELASSDEILYGEPSTATFLLKHFEKKQLLYM